MKVAVTGASGFVGGWVVRDLVRNGARVVACMRSAGARDAEVVPGAVPVVTGDVRDSRRWDRALAGCDAVVHLAGRAHVRPSRGNGEDSLQRAINAEGTRNVADAAAAVGVRRFVFLSSVGVSGDATQRGSPLRASGAPRPGSAYARSKLEAERMLVELAGSSGMQVVRVRPPMVYGPGAPGNLRSLTRAIRLPVPLPLGAIDNRRAFVAATTLSDFIVHCIHSPRASGHALHVTDGDDVSTTTFIRRLSSAVRGRAPLIPVPHELVRATLRGLGMHRLSKSMLDDLEIDLADTRALTGWAPPATMEQSMAGMYSLPRLASQA